MARTEPQITETDAMAEAWKDAEAAEAARNVVSARISALADKRAAQREALGNANTEKARQAAIDKLIALDNEAKILPDEAAGKAERHAAALYRWARVAFAEAEERKEKIRAEGREKVAPIIEQAARAEALEDQAQGKKGTNAEAELGDFKAKKGVGKVESLRGLEGELNRRTEAKVREEADRLLRLIKDRCRGVFGWAVAKEMGEGVDHLDDNGQLALRETFLVNVRQRADARLRGETV